MNDSFFNKTETSEPSRVSSSLSNENIVCLFLFTGKDKGTKIS